MLLNLCWDFRIKLLFFMKSLWLFLKVSAITLFFSSCFILFSSWVALKQFLNSLSLRFLFMTHFFVPFPFFLYCYGLLNICLLWLSMQQIVSLFFHLSIKSYFTFFCNVCINVFCFFYLYYKVVYPYKIVLLYFPGSHNHTKTHTLFIILLNSNIGRPK